MTSVKNVMFGIDFSPVLCYNYIINKIKVKYAHLRYILTKRRAQIMSLECIQNANIEDTGFNYTMSLIQGKYKMFILYTLMEYGTVRFNEMKRYISGISYKTLSVTLKELEADGLIHREEYPQIPPKVEYSLTGRGKSLIPILDMMCEWGDKHRQ